MILLFAVGVLVGFLIGLRVGVKKSQQAYEAVLNQYFGDVR